MNCGLLNDVSAWRVRVGLYEWLVYSNTVRIKRLPGVASLSLTANRPIAMKTINRTFPSADIFIDHQRPYQKKRINSFKRYPPNPAPVLFSRGRTSPLQHTEVIQFLRMSSVFPVAQNNDLSLISWTYSSALLVFKLIADVITLTSHRIWRHTGYDVYCTDI